jgi:hypothetical protein
MLTICINHAPRNQALESRKISEKVTIKGEEVPYHAGNCEQGYAQD